MMRVATMNNWIKGFNIGNQGMRCKYVIFYMQMTLSIFVMLRRNKFVTSRVILTIFEAVSGLAVYWRKSSIFQVKEVANLQSLASILHYRTKEFPTYLGMPLGNNHKDIEIWDGIIEKQPTGKLSMYHLEEETH